MTREKWEENTKYVTITLMSDKSILEKAIQKAIDGGWTIHNLGHYVVDDTATFIRFDNFDIESKNWHAPVTVIKQTETLIFDHDFAKALWGEEPITEYYPSPVSRSAFAHHLQQMVISEDPIRYLGENI